ncbi:hypothetical protein M427DRAFT_34287 [Gonapodya prolifera JEL478]|uniref:Uncharacterized protein n=1 Tax=Gonapodya prolifera (strain JEL478) TaxID=1344416 RepID=A0A139A8B5_GONPJ|nr:hypothetical protein M427DRAFT_34287 [Gonapodya prolifera JEL478]|eukprot:KXS13051.1 hypothetical protein M427DRAFT_34287 [Gonapodya prolifera JEL478]
MDLSTVSNLAINAFGSGLAVMAFIVVTINLYGSRDFGRQLHVRYMIYLIADRRLREAVTLAMFANVMNIISSHQGACTPVWSRLNNICYYTTKIIFTDIALIRFVMVTPDLPKRRHVGMRVFAALWYAILLVIVQVGSGFDYSWCQMVFALEPGYPLFAFQFLVDIVTTARFFYVLYSLRWRKKEIYWISLIIDITVILAVLSSLADSIIALSELGKPVLAINWERLLASGSAHFIIAGCLYCVMSVYSHLDKSSSKSNLSSRGARTSVFTSTTGQNKTGPRPRAMDIVASSVVKPA